MAKKVGVDIRKIVGYLDTDFRMALANAFEQAVKEGHIKDDKILNEEKFYLVFKERAARDFGSWEEVPEECVDVPEKS